MTLKISENPILRPPAPAGITVGRVESELRHLPHLSGDRRLQVIGCQRRMADARKTLTARQAIGELPGSGEALHLVISGRFALWNFVEAIHEMAGRIDELTISTLGFSVKNIDALCGMLDDRQIGRVWLLASHYFRGTSPVIFAHARTELDKRSDRATFVSLRNHTKIVLLKMADGRTFAIESSANLRSCKSIETALIVGDPAVYEFHHRWIMDLFAAANPEARR